MSHRVGPDPLWKPHTRVTAAESSREPLQHTIPVHAQEVVTQSPALWRPDQHEAGRGTGFVYIVANEVRAEHVHVKNPAPLHPLKDPRGAVFVSPHAATGPAVSRRATISARPESK